MKKLCSIFLALALLIGAIPMPVLADETHEVIIPFMMTDVIDMENLSDIEIENIKSLYEGINWEKGVQVSKNGTVTITLEGDGEATVTIQKKDLPKSIIYYEAVVEDIVYGEIPDDIEDISVAVPANTKTVIIPPELYLTDEPRLKVDAAEKALTYSMLSGSTFEDLAKEKDHKATLTVYTIPEKKVVLDLSEVWPCIEKEGIQPFPDFPAGECGTDKTYHLEMKNKGYYKLSLPRCIPDGAVIGVKVNGKTVQPVTILVDRQEAKKTLKKVDAEVAVATDAHARFINDKKAKLEAVLSRSDLNQNELDKATIDLERAFEGKLSTLDNISVVNTAADGNVVGKTQVSGRADPGAYVFIYKILDQTQTQTLIKRVEVSTHGRFEVSLDNTLPNGTNLGFCASLNKNFTVPDFQKDILYPRNGLKYPEVSVDTTKAKEALERVGNEGLSEEMKNAKDDLEKIFRDLADEDNPSTISQKELDEKTAALKAHFSAPPTDLLWKDGTVSGKGVPNAAVTLKDATGENLNVTATVDKDGTFSLAVPQEYSTKDILRVSQTEPNKPESDAVPVKAYQAPTAGDSSSGSSSSSSSGGTSSHSKNPVKKTSAADALTNNAKENLVQSVDALDMKLAGGIPYTERSRKAAEEALQEAKALLKTGKVTAAEYDRMLQNITHAAGDLRLQSTLDANMNAPFLFGYPDERFYPEKSMSRAEVAAMLVRLMPDRPADGDIFPSEFSDVHAGDWYANVIGFMSGKGLLAGYPDGNFRPNAHITRAEFAAIAARFVSAELSSDKQYMDVDADHWAADVIADVTAAGWVAGYDGDLFKPQGDITRAEAAAIANRMIDRHIDAAEFAAKNDVIRYNDVPESFWAYEDILLATNIYSTP